MNPNWNWSSVFLLTFGFAIGFLAGVAVNSLTTQPTEPGPIPQVTIEREQPDYQAFGMDEPADGEPPKLPPILLTAVYVDPVTGALYIIEYDQDGQYKGMRKIVFTDTDIIRLEFVEDLL